MPAQVPKTQEIGKFAASFRCLRSEKPSASGGFAPPGPQRPWTLGLCPQTPVIGSRSALAMAWPPPMKISAYAPAKLLSVDDDQGMSVFIDRVM